MKNRNSKAKVDVSLSDKGNNLITPKRHKGWRAQEQIKEFRELIGEDNIEIKCREIL